MTPNRSYLLRALHEWILDNGMTPHLLVDTTVSGTDVPRDFIDNNQILLNIHPDAVHNLVLGTESVTFSARFNGKPCHIYIPVNSVTAIYAKETGKGMIFPVEQDDEMEMTENDSKKSKKSYLKVIK